MNQKPKLNFKNWKCFISLGYYNAGSRLAIQLLSDEEDADKVFIVSLLLLLL